jgi:glycosyltransferase involved in cell wall biosynthesis
MRKYLFVSHSSVLHGAEISLLELIKLLRKTELCKIQVVLPNPIEDQAFLMELINLDVEVVRFNYKFTRWVDQDFRKLIFLKQNILLILSFWIHLFRARPDIIVFNTVVITPTFAFVSRFFKSKKIWLIHELGTDDHGYRFLFGKRFSIKLVFKLVDQVVYNSIFTKSKYEVEFACERKTSVFYPVISNFAHSNVKLEYKTGKYRTKIWKILVLGRTCEGKGQMDALIALNILVKKYNIHNLKLCLVGKVQNEYTDEMIEYSNRYELNDYIVWVDFTDKLTVHKYLCDSDIAIVTSRNEAFGRITVEYLFYGLIVIGTNVGGTKEILKKFENCTYTYSPGNTNQLVEHLNTIINMETEEFNLKVKTVMENSVRYFNDNRYFEEWNKILIKLGI